MLVIILDSLLRVAIILCFLGPILLSVSLLNCRYFGLSDHFQFLLPEPVCLAEIQQPAIVFVVVVVLRDFNLFRDPKLDF